MKIDARITKTKNKLSDALSILLSETTLSSITVKDLVNKANVNRSTFYLHYKNLDEFLDDLESDIYHSLEVKLDQFFNNTSWLGYIIQPNHHENLPILEFILNEISQNIQLQAFITSRKYESGFLLKMVENGYQNAVKSHQNIYPKVALQNFRYYYSFVSMGFVGILFTWIENDLKEPVEEISQMVHNMIYQNLNMIV